MGDNLDNKFTTIVVQALKETLLKVAGKEEFDPREEVACLMFKFLFMAVIVRDTEASSWEQFSKEMLEQGLPSALALVKEVTEKTEVLAKEHGLDLPNSAKETAH